MTEFRVGDRVKMKYFYNWGTGEATGEVTIVTEHHCKVIFDGEYDLNYDYYNKNDLELIERKDDRI